jgi:hypothetical protein
MDRFTHEAILLTGCTGGDVAVLYGVLALVGVVFLMIGFVWGWDVGRYPDDDHHP